MRGIGAYDRHHPHRLRRSGDAQDTDHPLEVIAEHLEAIGKF